MKRHLSNAAWGVIDYAAYPMGMLLVAPIVLHGPGPAAYGVWTVATALTSTGAIMAAGFGDANIKHVAGQRAAGDQGGLEITVRSMVGLNLILGICFMGIGWLLAPGISRHVVSSDMALRIECVTTLRLASVMILVRALESVCISTQRAFERYGAAVRVSLGCRVATLVVAGWLAGQGFGTTALLVATVVVTVAGVVVQFRQLQHLLHGIPLSPVFHRETIRALFAFGIFSWLQAVAGVIVAQGDRLLIGVSLGAVAVASYSLCVQLAQPLYGVTAAALHFLFPSIAGRLGTLTSAGLRHTLAKAFAANLLVVLCGAALLLTMGPRLLSTWAGAAMERAAAPVLPLIVVGTALLGLGVTGTYALLALGRVRAVSLIGVGGAVAMVLLMMWLLPVKGVYGLASARLVYGGLALLVYPPLLIMLARGQQHGSGFHTQGRAEVRPA